MNKVDVTIRVSECIDRTCGDIPWDVREFEFSGYVAKPTLLPDFLRDAAHRMEQLWTTARAEEGGEE